MARIKIKSRNNNKDQKLKLIEILCGKDIEIRRVIPTNDGFVVITVTEQDADSIFNREVKHELAQHELIPVLSPELKAKKSTIIPRVDDVIYEHDILESGEDLTDKNQWIGDELESVYKFQNTPTIRITFTHTTIAKICTEVGLKEFRMSIERIIKSRLNSFLTENHIIKEQQHGFRTYKSTQTAITIMRP